MNTLVYNFYYSSITIDYNNNLITIYNYRSIIHMSITVYIFVKDIKKVDMINLHNFISLKSARNYIYRYLKKNNIEYYISR